MVTSDLHVYIHINMNTSPPTYVHTHIGKNSYNCFHKKFEIQNELSLNIVTARLSRSLRLSCLLIDQHLPASTSCAQHLPFSRSCPQNHFSHFYFCEFNISRSHKQAVTLQYILGSVSQFLCPFLW